MSMSEDTKDKDPGKPAGETQATSSGEKGGSKSTPVKESKKSPVFQNTVQHTTRLERLTTSVFENTGKKSQ